MKVASVSEMKRIDALADSRYGIKELVLMENAGHETALAVWQVCDERPSEIVVIAGTGNNGGDGFVAARHLAALGCRVRVFLVGALSRLKASALINFTVLKKMELPVINLATPEMDAWQWNTLADAVGKADCVVDALLGTGVRLPLRKAWAAVVRVMNDLAKRIVSVDVPSGIDADTGAVSPDAVRATVTVTFGLLKQGMCFYPAAEYCGQIKTAAIGLPQDLLKDENIKQNLIDNKMVQTIIGTRSASVHKGSCGRVVVIAGSVGLTGAAALASTAALRIGAGLVTLGIPQSLQEVMAIKLTEVMTHPLPDHDGALCEAAVDEMLRLSEKADVVLIGPGLGRSAATGAALRSFLQQTDKTVVIDADAIFALSGYTALLKSMKKTPVLTPHIGEMAMLSGQDAIAINADMIFYSRVFAEAAQAILVLKSARTVVAYPDGTVYINTKGNAGMATGGCGDVLAGTIAGLLAEKKDSRSVIAGVSIHAAAGDIAAAGGMEGLIAGDIAAALPKARAHSSGWDCYKM